jgi:hypothetical protein
MVCVSDDQFGGRCRRSLHNYILAQSGPHKKLVFSLGFFRQSELKYRLSDIILFKNS